MSVSRTNPNQLAIPSYLDEVVSPDLYPPLAPASRTRLTTVLTSIGQVMPMGPEPTYADYLHALPNYIEGGLYILPQTKAYDEAHHVVRLGVIRGEIRNHGGNVGVAFQPAEYTIVARSPRDLGRSAVNRTRHNRWGGPDREKDHDAAMRSAGHALTAKIATQTSLMTRLEEENATYRHLLKHLYHPDQVRIRAGRLRAEWSLADERIHDTAELATVHLGLKNTAIVGLHRAIKRLQYGNYSHAERTSHVVGFLRMVGLHGGKKMEKILLSSQLAQNELKTYQPYLDGKEPVPQAA